MMGFVGDLIDEYPEDKGSTPVEEIIEKVLVQFHVANKETRKAALIGFLCELAHETIDHERLEDELKA